jgi:molybdate transport system ATP-binding protein
MDLETRSRTVAIFGPSGAGKTTLLRVLAGVERRARGRLDALGETWLDSATGQFIPPWDRRVGWVPQDAGLFPHLSVLENLRYGNAGVQQAREIAALVEVEHLVDRSPRRLSGGERQRVAVGRALCSDPRILLLDEPFSALDRPLRERLAECVRGWADERGLPIVLVSHDEQDTDVLADEHWHLADGVLELSGEAPRT